MRRRNARRFKLVLALWLAALVIVNFPAPPPVRAGEPGVVAGGPFPLFGEVEGQIMKWDLSGGCVPYTTDGGGLGTLNNAGANALVATSFGVWDAVATSTICAARTGQISAALVPDGDVNTAAEFSILGTTGNPVIYDADGSLLDELFGVGASNFILGQAGPSLTTGTPFFTSGRGLLNGKAINGDPSDGVEVTVTQMESTAIHEFGHFFGLGHSQINNHCRASFLTCHRLDDAVGLPTMYPIEITDIIGGVITPLAEPDGTPFGRTLAHDDVAWISFIYPTAGFATSHGRITGEIFFSDGVTGVQGGNVLAIQNDDPATMGVDESKRNIVSGVSGYLFAGNLGNPAVNHPRSGFGSAVVAHRGLYDLPGLPPGNYTVRVESLDPDWVGGSSIGPLAESPHTGAGEQIPLPGAGEFFSGAGESETEIVDLPAVVAVAAGATASDIDIILGLTPPTFDSFESAGSRNDTVATATAITNGTTSASLSPFLSADVDVYSFPAVAGATVTVEIGSRRMGTPRFLDSVLEILDSTGTRLNTCRTTGIPDDPFDDPCVNDDFDFGQGLNKDSRIEFRPAASGTFFVRVSDKRGDARPDFLYELTLSGTTAGPADLRVIKTDNGVTFVRGTNRTYSITVENIGTSDTSGTITLTDTLPAGLGFVSGTGTDWSCVLTSAGPPQVVTCTRTAPLAAGASTTITLTVSVGESTASNITNTATVSGGGDSSPGNNSGSDDTVVASSADLAVTKTDSADPVAVGQQFTYTITVTNNGPSAATSVRVVDSLIGDVTFGLITPSQGSCGVPSGGVFSCELGSLASGASATITIQVTPNAGAGGSRLDNLADVSNPDQPDPNSSNNSDTEFTAVTAQVNLSVVKADSPDPVRVGESLRYTITVSNAGPATATGVTLTDMLPAGVTFISSVPGVPTCTHLAGVVTCDLGAIASGGQTVVTIDVLAPGTPGTITNTASATANEADTNPANNSDSEDTAVVRTDLTILKDDAAASFLRGANGNYTITVSNIGTAPSTAAILVTDTLPAGLTFVSGTGTDWSCVLTDPGPPQTVTCTRTTPLAAGASTIITLTVAVGASTANNVTNTATVSGGNDAVPGNNSDSEDTPVLDAPVVDLTITKTDGGVTFFRGANGSYSITVSNVGNTPTSGAFTVTDTLPIGLTFVSGTGTDWSCVLTSAGPPQVVTCTRTTPLAAGASTTITLVVAVGESTLSSITNTATVAGGGDNSPANNSGSDDTSVASSADLVVTKTDSADPVGAGQVFSYTVRVRNNGPSTAVNVVARDTLPGGVVFVSSVPGAPTCTHLAGVVTCNLGTLASGASVDVVISVLAPAAPGVIVNTAGASADTPDPVTGNDSDQISTTVTARVDLEVAKSDAPDPVRVGQQLTYAIAVRNNGPSDATGVTLTDTLPPVVTFVSSTPGAPTCTHLAGVVTCNLGTLASGAQTVVTIEVVAPGTPGTITNTASATANEADSVPGNNSDSESTQVIRQADLAVAKVDSLDPVNAGAQLAYTVTLTNNGPDSATGVVLTDNLPAGVTFVSVAPTPACAHSAGVVTCTVGTLASGATFTATITVNAPAEGGTITNTASATTTDVDPDATNNSDSEPTAVTAQTDLAVTKTDSADPVSTTQEFSYTVRVTNNGPSTATGVTLTDTLPAGVTFVSVTPTPACAHSAGVVTCNVGTLASSATFTATITVRAPGAPGTVSNRATVAGGQADPNAANNSVTENTTVAQPSTSFNPTSVDFGNQALNSTSAGRGIVFTNTGSTTLFISGISITGANAGDFNQTNNCGVSLGPGANCTITGTFTPTGTGRRDANVSVASNAAGSPNTVPLTGTGVDFNVASPTAPQTVSAGQSAQYTINVPALGGAFGNPVTLGCEGLPVGAACQFAQNPVTPGSGGTSTSLTISTTGTASAFAPPVSGFPGWRWPLAWMALLAALLTTLLGLKLGGHNLRAWRPRVALVLLVLAAAGGTVGCLGGFPAEGRDFTPPGSYSIRVTGTSGNLVRSTNVTLNVR